MHRQKLSLGKIDYNNSGRRNCEVTVEWELSEDGRFSMTGYIWNPRKTDCYSCGQNLYEIAKFFPHHKKFQRMLAIWKRWHLNDMKAGCEHQRSEGWDKRPIDASKPLDTYGKHFPEQRQDSWNMLTWVDRDEHPAGLLSYPCPTCGYKYGSAWLREDLPADVVAEINSWLTTAEVTATAE